MYHVCFSNPGAWNISYENGVYGNVETGNETQKVFWGKMVDLLALKTGDKVFFYVKENMVLRGVFEVACEPYYCQDDLFENNSEAYPFRFNFNEIKHFENPVPVSELAKLIEKGMLHSITTFERDANAAFRGIRQLTNDEGNLIEEIFLKYNAKGDQTNTRHYTHNEITESLDAKEIINSVIQGEDFTEPVEISFNSVPAKRVRVGVFSAQYESSLQGYLYYSLRRNINGIIEDIDVNNFSECLLEVPMLKAQQFRSDVLCLYQEKGKAPHFYSIIEIKKETTISITDLSQLIGYMKTFSEAKGIAFNRIEGIYISLAFEDEAIQYLRNRKNVEKENPIRLIKYSADINGQVSFHPISI